jgi:hypothetical protein
MCTLRQGELDAGREGRREAGGREGFLGRYHTLERGEDIEVVRR